MPTTRRHRRLQAEVLLKCGKADDAEAVYRESLDIARTQGARWLELRAARGYASFLIERNRAGEARELLRVGESIPEGRSTMDYVYSEALLRPL